MGSLFPFNLVRDYQNLISMEMCTVCLRKATSACNHSFGGDHQIRRSPNGGVLGRGKSPVPDERTAHWGEEKLG